MIKIFAISDLHLSLNAPYLAGDTVEPCLYKPMDVFGSAWRDFFARLESNWRATVSDEDTVLIAGDISWALTLEDARHDLAYICSLPGHKVMIKGNHDYWWSSVSRLRDTVDSSVTVLQHSAALVGDWAVCGTRGWLAPEHGDFTESNDRRLYEREMLRLRMALDEAAKLDRSIIVMLHYPPLFAADSDSDICRLLAEYPVKCCLYGHIHGDRLSCFEGERDGIIYRNCSIDRLNFTPLLIASGEDLA